jgi:branched-chain amino acid transport system substrate-binding protein
VADVSERHGKLMIAPMAATTSIWEKGRRYLVMLISPNEALSDGLLDLAVRNGLRTVAVINEDGLVAKAALKGTSEQAKQKGLELVFSETYAKDTSDFSDILNRVNAARPDVLVSASVRLEDLVAITRQMSELDINVPYGGLAGYYERLGKLKNCLQRLFLGGWPALPGKPRVRHSLRE